jgi:hypothetical protein
MEEEVFHHRFGKRPTAASIFQSISTLQEDKLPLDGGTSSQGYTSSGKASLVEIDSLLIDDRNHRLLLIFLYMVQRGSARLNASITASWDKRTSTGVCISTCCSLQILCDWRL